MPFQWNVKSFGTLPSTQDYLKELVQSNDPSAVEGLVITTQKQPGGRGRHGNQWDGPQGNLYQTFLLTPHCTPLVAGQYSFLMAVALVRAMQDFMDEGHALQLKWPNDVLIDEKKCAGILLESELSNEGLVTHLYVGVGVNINSAPDDRIGLGDVTSKDVSISVFQESFLNHIGNAIEQFKRDGFELIREEWLAQAYKMGKTIRVRLPHEILHGVFEGLDENGTLLLRLDNGDLQRITSGEVYF